MIKYINLLLFFFIFQISAKDNKFVILIPSFNNKDWYKQNLDSVFAQTYQNYRVIYIDDCSDDNTANLVETYVNQNNQSQRFTLIRNQKRQLALPNIYRAVFMCSDDEIVVMVDGDDQLANNNVLQLLNEIYQDEGIWITHGNYKYLSTNTICDYNPSFPDNIVKKNQFREFPHGLTHLRTFYSWLFKLIKLEDLFFEDYFFKMAPDVAIYLPMIEMAGNRHKYIKEILYIYNDLNPINEHKICVSLQHHINRLIRKKEKYVKLEQPKNTLNRFEYKTDLIIFAENLSESQSLMNVVKNLNWVKNIFIVYENNNVKLNLFHNSSNIILVNKKQNSFYKIIRYTLENEEKYIMFANPKWTINKEINFNNLINLMEQSKINSAFFCKDISSDLKNYLAQISNQVFTFKFCRAKFANFINAALYKKENINLETSEIDKIEIEWKYLNWNKVSLVSYE